jgi:hypothetical protein
LSQQKFPTRHLRRRQPPTRKTYIRVFHFCCCSQNARSLSVAFSLVFPVAVASLLRAPHTIENARRASRALVLVHISRSLALSLLSRKGPKNVRRRRRCCSCYCDDDGDILSEMHFMKREILDDAG